MLCSSGSNPGGDKDIKSYRRDQVIEVWPSMYASLLPGHREVSSLHHTLLPFMFCLTSAGHQWMLQPGTDPLKP